MATVAGTGESGSDGDGGPARRARLSHCLTAIALDSRGNLYVADAYNHRIRKVAYDGTISTLAGNGHSGYSGDRGPALQAKIGDPKGLAVDAENNVLYSDSLYNCVRKIGTDGIITTLAGTGKLGYSGDGGPAQAARLNRPRGLAVGKDDSLYVVDSFNRRIRKIGPDGIISTVAGTGEAGVSGDGGPARMARFLRMSSIAIDPSGNLYILDTGAGTIRKIDPGGIISRAVGSGKWGNSGEGGPALAARFKAPFSIAVDEDGNLFIADTGNYRICKVDPHGTFTTVAGGVAWGFSGDEGPAVKARIDYPTSLAIDALGDLFIADAQNRRIRRISWAAAHGLFAGRPASAYARPRHRLPA